MSGPRDIRPGDVLVVDSAVGGLDRWGWTGTPGGGAVRDIGDLVARGRGPRTRRLARLTKAVVASVVGKENGPEALGSEWERLCNRLKDEDDPPGDAELRVLANAVLERLHDAVADDDPLADVIRAHYRDFIVGKVTLLPSGSGVLVEQRGPTTLDVADDSSASGSSALGGSSVRLADPVRNVGQRAAAFATNIGLSDGLVATLRAAGRMHDLGKADVRFQAMLRGGDRLRAEVNSGFEMLLAKSGMNPANRRAWRAAAQQSGWPQRMRHEAVSVALLRELPQGWAGEGVDGELLDHLVAAHHGWARPLFPAIADTDPQEVEVVIDGHAARALSDALLIDWSQPARFHRLCRRYGWWGLALVETVLRLADMAVSEEGS